MNRISQGYSFKNALLLVLPWMAILLMGLWLRLGPLESRPMHADEGVQGMITAELLESGDYAYNPRKFHGPGLYYLTLPVAAIRGQATREQLDRVTLRLVPLAFGMALILTPLLFRRELGVIGTPVAATFLALSPGLAYFSTFYIQEMLLVTGFAILLGSFWRYCVRPGWGWAVFGGLGTGLMAASKESAVLFLVIVLASGGVTLLRMVQTGEHPPLNRVSPVRDSLLFMVAASIVLVPLYTSLGAHPHGLLDAIRGLYQYEPEPGHDKPWYYYLSLLSGAERGSIFRRGEGTLFLVSTLAVLLMMIRHRKVSISHYLILSGSALFVLFSVFPYKTPWLILEVIVPMALLSGLACEWAFRSLRASRFRITGSLAGAVVLSTVWCLSLRESLWTTRTFPIEKRNPYAYVHTSWDLEELTHQVLELTSGTPGAVVKVMADEYWPIPWYLRSVENVGYWPELPEDPYAPVMIVSAELAGGLDPEVMNGYHSTFRGLRPGKILLLYWTQDE